MRPESFVPAIIHRLDRQKPWIQWLDGTVLFADISGFTPMAEALSALGAEGAEILTSILNRYFSETIGIIQSQGGETMKFGGDALMCLFSGLDSEEKAAAAAACIQTATSKYQNIITPIKKFTLQVKIGIASGPVMVSGIGDPSIRCDYLLAGNAVDKSVQAERTATAGETVIALRENGSFTKIKSTAIHSVISEPLKRNTDETDAKRTEAFAATYLISEIYEMIRLGYDRFVGALLNSVPAFLEFSGYQCEKEHFALESFHDFFNQVTNCAHQFGGRLNGVMMGDKGSNFLFYFGAPNLLEKKEKAAIEWSLEVLDLVRKNFPQIAIKIGITEGKVFSGIIGGSGRFHYAVVGDCVNLAARLTHMADVNQICVSKSLKQKENESFSFDELGTRKVKGKLESISVYAVRTKILHKITDNVKVLCGRDAEVETILHHLQSSYSGIPKMLVIEGRAGAGKSALCDLIASKTEDELLILRGSSEITRKNHPYSSWQSIFESLKLKPPLDHAESSSILQQEQKTRLHHQLSQILLKEISNRKTLLILEDLHWFDSLSLELLTSFLNHLRNEPLFVLATARPEWEKSDFVHRPICNFLSLSELDRTATGNAAEEILHGTIKPQLLDFLYSNSKGNPFLLQNLLQYLVEKTLVVRIAGEWNIKHEAKLLENLSGAELVAAQLEGLSLPERIHLQTAACMGPTFLVPVLSAVLGKRFRKTILRRLCKSRYFQDSDTEWNSFQQGLIQEAIYYSLPVKRRKNIHRRIARAMEDILHEEESRYLPNLANHFRLAGIRDKAISYSLAASEILLSSQSYPEASQYLEAAYNLLRNTTDHRKWIAGVKFAEALIYSGKLEKSFEISRDLRNRARRNRQWNVFYSASALHFDAMRRKSDYSYLPSALKLVNKYDSMDSNNKSRILYLAGSAHFWLGNTNKAEPILKQALALRKKTDGDEVTISAYVFLASIYADRSQKEEAAEWIQAALRLAESSDSKYQTIRIRHEWAGILSDAGEPEEALRILHELLPQTETLGDFYLAGAILTSLAHAEIKLSQWDVATTYVDEAAALFKNLGMLHGHAQATMLAGILAFYKNNYSEAYNLYKLATDFFETAGENLEACHGYYNLAEVCLKRNKKDEAELWLKKGLKSFDAENNPQLARMYEELKPEINRP